MPAPQPTPLWTPSARRIEQANVTAFTRWVNAREGLDLHGYDALWQWSIDELEAFWVAIWDRYDVVYDGSPEPGIAHRSMPGTSWFPNARINYAEHVFRGRDPGAVAIRHASELRPSGAWTWAELHAQTAAIAGGLRRLGVGVGDRVVGYLPNLPETVAAFLACASLGATWSSCSPDFGSRTVVDRFAQIEPKVLLAVDGYRYGGRDFDRRQTVAEIADGLPGLQHTVTFGLLDGSGWPDAFLDPRAELRFQRLLFDHPLWVLFSSGTTGLPKAIVQGHGGILLEQLKHHHLHLDAGPGDRVMWFTTTGWMMWNFLVGVLLTGSEIVLYDGNPAHPDLGTLWDVAADAGVTTFGTSAAFLAASRKAGVRPGEGRDLSALRAVGSTGSPLSPEAFRWVYDELGADTWLFSTSGGTDVCTAFLVGTPTLPVYEGELQARGLGCAVAAWDDDGVPVAPGQVGELVITEPMPSMPVFMWNDPADVRLKASYFEPYEGVWRHGDWLELTDRGTAVIHGRSDATINRGGVRMGTAELYAAVLAEDEVTDALVVDVPRPGHEDGWMALFVTLQPGARLDDRLRGAVAGRLRRDCSPRHVPDDLFVVDAVPRTLTGKVLEVPVKRILMGHDPDRVVSRGSLADPAALEPFIALAGQLAAPAAAPA